jgi:hypothetical protein
VDAGGADGGADGGRADGLPPEIRDVRATLASPEVTFDLSSGSERRQIFTPSSLELRVFASDDVTPAEELSVALVDPADGSIYSDTTRAFERGLWILTHEAAPGLAFTLVVTDAAGRATPLGNTLTFPTLADGITRAWTALQYDTSETLTAQVEERWMDGRFCHLDAGGPGGTYTVAGDTLSVQERHTSPCGTDPGAEGATVERTIESQLYVDDTYFALSRYDRGEGGETDTAGVWERSSTVTDAAGSSTRRVDTLTLSEDGSYQQTIDEGGVIGSESGTYEVATNSDYTFDYGDFLIFRVERRDGTTLPAPETELRWFVLRDGHLLVEPLVDLSAH